MDAKEIRAACARILDCQNENRDAAATDVWLLHDAARAYAALLEKPAKGLAWEPTPNPKCFLAWAAGTSYCIAQEDGRADWSCIGANFDKHYDRSCDGQYESLDAAKAACETHWQSTVRAMLRTGLELNKGTPMGSERDVVGHKTFFENGKFRHEPLTRAEADAVHESWERSEKRRQDLMPTEQDAINVLFDAWYRLTKDFGWKDDARRRAPRDGTQFLTVELGSSGQHVCHGDEIGFWVHSDGDLWPSDPALFKPQKDQQ